MKSLKHFLLICLLYSFAFTVTKAQNYLIDFTASGTATTLDSVYAENFTQGISLTLQGNDTLNLIGTTFVSFESDPESYIKIYPNPFNETSNLAFYSETTTIVDMCIYNVHGVQIYQASHKIQKGSNLFEVSGLPTGYYQLIASTNRGQKSIGFVSLNSETTNPQVRFISGLSDDYQLNFTPKSTKSILQMSYNAGDQIKFIGYHDSIYVVVNDMPTSSKTIDFVFSTSSCGAILTDVRDGNQYPTIQTGSQCWMAKNLAYLPSVADTTMGSPTTPLYYVYGYNDTVVADAKATSNYTTYGVLYNWPAAMNGEVSSAANPSGVQGVCPTGWHLPSDAEWTQLTDYLGDVFVAGGKLKEAGYSHWVSPNTGATNETGFTGLPGGTYSYSLKLFYNINYHGTWWSTTETSATWAWHFRLRCDMIFANRSNSGKNMGYSVRCVKD